MKFSGNTECEGSFIDRFIPKWKNCVELIEKSVKGHIIPYLSWFITSRPSVALQAEPVLIFYQYGKLSEVLSKAYKIIQDVQHGMVVVQGEEINGKLYMAGGKVSEAVVVINSEVVNDLGATLMLLNSSLEAEVYVYSVSVEHYVRQALDRAYTLIMKKKLTGDVESL